jgi:hypothetical protein
MENFSVPLICSVSLPDLAKRIEDTRLSNKQRETLKVLLDGAEEYGVIVRDKDDNDAPTIGKIYRMEYEQCVNTIVSAKITNEHLRNLAYDLSAVAYHEAWRCKTQNPSSLGSLRDLLAV